MSRKIDLRFEAKPSDAETIRQIVSATGFFRHDEVDIAVELVEERLSKGESSGYYFVFAEIDWRRRRIRLLSVPFRARLAVSICTGSPSTRNFKAMALDNRSCKPPKTQIREFGGRHIYIDTSGRPQYAPTRAFYKRCGYEIAATLTDFYSEGDDKVVWRKRLGQ